MSDSFSRRQILKAAGGFITGAASASSVPLISNLISGSAIVSPAQARTIIYAGVGGRATSKESQNYYNAASLSDAMLWATSGDLVLIKPGTYYGFENLPSPGGVTVDAYNPAQKPIISGLTGGTTRKQYSFHPQDDGGSGFTLKNLIIEEYVRGVYIQAPNFTAENCTFRYNRSATNSADNTGTGLYIGSYGDTRSTNARIYKCEFLYNDLMGIDLANCANSLIDDCYFEGNNVKMNGVRSDNSKAAGIKVIESENVVVRKSSFINNKACGIWFDVHSHRGRIVGNFCKDNTNSGIFVEISNNCIVLLNTVVNNLQGIRISTGTNHSMYHNTLVGNANQIFIIDSDRTDEAGAGYQTKNIVIKNNLSQRNPGQTYLYASDGGSNGFTGAMIAYMNYNGYRTDSFGERQFLLQNGANYTSLTELKARTIYEDNAKEATDLKFANTSADDYTPLPGSIAINGGTTVSSEVADLAMTHAGVYLSTTGTNDLGAVQV